MTNTLLTVTIDQTATRTIVHLTGEIDMGTATILEDGLDRALTGQTRGTMVVDLRSVTFLASAGLAALAAAHARAGKTNTTLVVLTAVGSSPERAIRITHLDRVFRVVNNLDQALTSTS